MGPLLRASDVSRTDGWTLPATGEHMASVPPDSDLAERELLAARLLDAMEFDQRISRRYDSLTRDRARQSSTSPAAQDALRAVIELRRRVVTPELLRPHVIARYVAAFTSAELRELVGFYESPVGKKFVRLWSDDDDTIKRVMTEATDAHAGELVQAIADLRR